MTEQNTLEEKFISLHKIIEKLRDKKEGCPWFLDHDHKKLKPYLIEEAYETCEAIEEGDDKKTLDELGDVLLQVMLHAQIASERNSFSILDVMDNLSNKMIRRHPHVFSENSKQKFSNEAVSEQWEKIKQEERKDTLHHNNASILESKITKHYPATTQAKEIGSLVKKVNFDWEKPQEVLKKLNSELQELKDSFKEEESQGKFPQTEEEIGDLYFTLAQFCRHLNLDPETVAFSGNLKFYRRFKKLEGFVQQEKSNLSDKTKEELESLWMKVKESEKKIKQ